MGLSDFERELAESKPAKSHRKRERSRSRDRHHSSSKHSSSRRHHRRSSRDHEDKESRHGHKRSKHSREGERDEKERSYRKSLDNPRKSPAAIVDDDDGEDDWVEKESFDAPPNEDTLDELLEEAAGKDLRRDAWMEAPSSLDIDYVQRKRKEEKSTNTVATKKDYELKVHKNELNQHLRDLDEGKIPEDQPLEKPAAHEVSYVFGDSGSAWRMIKLKRVYEEAKESNRSVEEVAIERLGGLREFDDAREEEIEVDRRKMYGKDYVGKTKPSGELFEERKLQAGIRRVSSHQKSEVRDLPTQGTVMEEEEEVTPIRTVVLDQTALNKLKAQMMKAKLKKAANAAELESEYNRAVAAAAHGKPDDVVILNAMDNRLLTGGRKGEVITIDNKRGRERGLVVENEDMSIEDMVKQERRTRNQGEGMAFAERIAKDAKFDNDLDYLDENATKLSKHVQKSETNMRSTAISDYQKMNRILDNCPLCHNEDKGTPPVAPIVSLATRVYLTLPTEPEISKGGATIVPIQHRTNLLECDDDEWEEIRNFMKSLTRYYHERNLSVIFYENAAFPHKKRHATLEAVPLPLEFGETAPAFFREAILAADEEWSQHKKLIDTLALAKNSLGKSAFRRTLVKEVPYFHVWFTLDGGYGHIVEDGNRWPRGDLFAREIIGGMLDAEEQIIKRQGRWVKGDRRVEGFRKAWNKFDWSRVLSDG